MGLFLGLDTSNYTTSCAVFDTEDMSFRQEKRLLPVKSGERGLRQSDAVFHHTKQLPELMEKLFGGTDVLEGIGCSIAPRLAEGSYMPCFLVGQGAARNIAAVTGSPVFETSHQMGHILAALYSSGRTELLKGGKPFLAFHVSGGTTDLLLCEPDIEEVLKIREIGGSSDLKAGQCIDRVGVRLGLSFPCGAELEKLAEKCDRAFRIKASLKGTYCSLSGIENQCSQLMSKGEAPETVAKFCLDSVCEAVRAVASAAVAEVGDVPVIFAGGVMSDRGMKNVLSREFDAAFAEPALSSDNAVGVAYYAALRKGALG